MTSKTIRITTRFVAGTIVQFVLVPRAVTAARQATGLSQEEFARVCGWGRGIQRRLEEGDGLCSEQEARQLLRVMAQHHVEIEDLPVAPRKTLADVQPAAVNGGAASEAVQA